MLQLNYKCFMKSMILLILTALLHPHATIWWECVPFCLPLTLLFPHWVGSFPDPASVTPWLCISPLVWMATWLARRVAWCHWDIPRTTGSWEGPQSVLASFWHSEAAQWWTAGINVFLLFPLFLCPSLSTTSNGESRRLHLPPTALWALQPRDSGGVLLWPWLHPRQWLQVHHLPVRRVVPLLPSVLCQNR